MKKINTKLTVFLVVALLSLSTLAVAAPVNAKTIKLDVYAGQSIQTAIDSATEGAKITVHEGIYVEAITINKPIKLYGENAVIDLTGTNLKKIAFTGTASDVTISGFTIKGVNFGITMTGPNPTIENNQISCAAGAMGLYQAENAVVKNNTILASNTGISVSAGNPSNGPETGISNVKIIGNTINAAFMGIIPVKVFNSIVKDNQVQVTANGLAGIGLSGCNNKIVDNTVNGNCKQGINIRGLPFGTSTTPSTGNTISRNTVTLGTADADNGIYMDVSAKDNTISDNTISGADMGVMARLTGASGFTVKNNVISAQLIGINMIGYDSTIKGNIVTSQRDGIILVNATNAEVKNNDVTAVRLGIQMYAGTDSFTGMDEPITNIEVKNNIIRQSLWGLMFVKVSDSTIKDNEVVSSSYGIALSGCNNKISCNTVTGDFLYGINIRGMPFGDINTLTDSTGNSINSNRITGGNTAGEVGIYFYPSASSNTAKCNCISGVDFTVKDDGTNNIVH